MRRWGRRGNVPWMYEVLISLILLALCGYAMFQFIGANTKGEGFFSRYYAEDFSAIAQIAAAPQGDVIVRYDNFRSNVDLGFWFTNGKVAVGVPQRASKQTGDAAGSRITLPPGAQEPIGAVIGRYAPVPQYRTSAFERPSRLILTRRATTMVISDETVASDACPSAGAPQVPVAQAKAWFEVLGAVTASERDEAIASFRETIGSTRVAAARSADDATITIRLTRESGLQTFLHARPGGQDSVTIACDFAQQIRTLTLTDVGYSAPSVIPGAPVVVDATLTTDNEDRITPSQLGRAAAYAVLRRY